MIQWVGLFTTEQSTVETSLFVLWWKKKFDKVHTHLTEFSNQTFFFQTSKAWRQPSSVDW